MKYLTSFHLSQRDFASAIPDQIQNLQQQQQSFPSIVIGGKSQALEPQGSFAEAQTQVCILQVIVRYLSESREILTFCSLS